MSDKKIIISNCQKLLSAYKSGLLGQTVMPEDSSPDFSSLDKEIRLVYFTLPMALNYQRDSYKLWQSALKTFNDPETKSVFDIEKVSKMSSEELREKLLKYKLALQPNKHINTWQTISKTVYDNWGSFSNLIDSLDNDFLKIKDAFQREHKKGFPYISGTKIFNYWSFILKTYGKIDLKNAQYIDIAPDTHITKCSAILGVITEQEAEKLTKEQISERWRELLNGSSINPIDMHPPLWFWSRNGFIYKLK
ncbi:MAG: hypothetical protein PHU42_03635 [Patescibacteria group bacterium]|nr:hypothetical protein [Patescibacteria group bacterium]